jgi:ribosome modulation factor
MSRRAPWAPNPLPSHWEHWNPALRGAFRKGWECAQAGGSEADCPYQDKRTPSGRLSWSRSFITAWAEGFRAQLTAPSTQPLQ